VEIALIIIGIFNLIGIVFLFRKSNSNTNTDFLAQQTPLFENLTSKTERLIKDEFRMNREENAKSSKEHRTELSESFSLFREQQHNRFDEFTSKNASNFEKFEERINKLNKDNEERLSKIEVKVDNNLKEIQIKNAEKLEEMRLVVDEKLHSTLEKRLGESFKIVSERLEAVHKGLGDMQQLAVGVGDLKRVLTNVKTRGTWGEFQLGSLIEQLLTQNQYEKNVATKKGSSARVEFAIKLPNGKQNDNEIIWLPIDSKFPKEDFERLLTAQETANKEEVEIARKGIATSIKNSAKEIAEKYLAPPQTTDFAILFIPIESLYAEILSIHGLADFIQNANRVTIAGPANLTAILNSLQMGFRTLAIEKRSSEVWNLLSSVKTEFGKFGDLLDKTHKKLQEASNSIDEVSKKSRTIEGKLRSVEELPNHEPNLLS